MRSKLLWGAILGLLGASALGLFLFWDRLTPKRPVIGVLSHSRVTEPAYDGLRAGLANLGYHLNKDVTFLYDGASGSVQTIDIAAQSLFDRGADIIFAMSTPAALAAQKINMTLANPRAIVFAPSANPLESGLIEDLSHPGKHTTGVTFGFQEPRRLELLVTLVPQAKKLCYPYNPDDKSPKVSLEKLQEPAQKLGVVFREEHIRSVLELEQRLNEICLGTDAIFMPSDALIAGETEWFVQIAENLKVALSVPHRKGVEQGALMSYGFSLFDLGEQAASLVDQVLKGVDPGSLPVESADFFLTINPKAAQNIGLIIAPEILQQAKLIEGRK